MAETFNVVVEIPRGSKNKYEVDHETGRLRLGFPNERIIYMLPALLPIFHEKYPGVRIETNNAPGVRLLDFLAAGIRNLPCWMITVD